MNIAVIGAGRIRDAEVVFLAIPTKAVPELPRGLFANLDDSAIVIDLGNYHPELRDGRIGAIDQGMPDRMRRGGSSLERLPTATTWTPPP